MSFNLAITAVHAGFPLPPPVFPDKPPVDIGTTVTYLLLAAKPAILEARTLLQEDIWREARLYKAASNLLHLLPGSRCSIVCLLESVRSRFIARRITFGANGCPTCRPPWRADWVRERARLYCLPVFVAFGLTPSELAAHLVLLLAQRSLAGWDCMLGFDPVEMAAS